VTRSAADIGRGLAAARTARAILPGERIHVLGAAGAGASAAAILASLAGASVTACDPGAPSSYTPPLEALGIRVEPGHDPGHVRDPAGAAIVDRLAATKALTAVDPDHPELAAAREVGVPVEPWQQVVADVAKSRGSRLVAVAGTHGKSTSSGWLVSMLAGAGRDPSAFVGALMPAPLTGGVPSTARWGSGPEFIVEADEYAGNFDPYRPWLAVLLNAEWDHPDVFPDEEAVFAAFEAWIRRAAPGDGGGTGAGDFGEAGSTAGDCRETGRGQVSARRAPTAVVNVTDPGAARIAARLRDWPGHLVVVELAAPAGGRGDRDASGRRCSGSTLDDAAVRLRASYRTSLGAAAAVVAQIVASDTHGTALEIGGLAGLATPAEGIRSSVIGSRLAARLALPGLHVAQDGLAVAAAAAVLGVSAPAIVSGLEAFRGVGRRLELKGDVGGVVVLDDYAHHPTAIDFTLAAARQRYPGRRLWAVYEPLTYHRTAALLDRFAEVLASGADRVLVADIWAGRDPDTSIASAAGLAAAVASRGGAPATASGDVNATAEHLAAKVRPGDVVVIMGGGHSYRVAERLVALLRSGECGAATP
jgi:UDP-N-acetylmuramate--alanine ligase